MKDIENLVCHCVADLARLPVSQLDPDAHLAQDLGIDSIEVLRLLAELENRLGVIIPDSDLVRMDTPRHIWQQLTMLAPHFPFTEPTGSIADLEAPAPAYPPFNAKDHV